MNSVVALDNNRNDLAKLFARQSHIRCSLLYNVSPRCCSQSIFRVLVSKGPASLLIESAAARQAQDRSAQLCIS
eukprot:scaffold1119_cov108-Skeletonema_dohrnii-CCMP3373.AAC.4